jgi:hypothetical protein
MVWDIHSRRADRRGDHVTHVKARWTALGSIHDVSLDCGPGVRDISREASTHREMNAFSKAIEGDFRWDGEEAEPEVLLTWTDGGELCQERIPLAVSAEHHVLPGGLRKLLHSRSKVPVDPSVPS